MPLQKQPQSSGINATQDCSFPRPRDHCQAPQATQGPSQGHQLLIALHQAQVAFSATERLMLSLCVQSRKDMGHSQAPGQRDKGAGKGKGPSGHCSHGDTQGMCWSHFLRWDKILNTQSSEQIYCGSRLRKAQSVSIMAERAVEQSSSAHTDQDPEGSKDQRARKTPRIGLPVTPVPSSWPCLLRPTQLQTCQSIKKDGALGPSRLSHPHL